MSQSFFSEQNEVSVFQRHNSFREKLLMLAAILALVGSIFYLGKTLQLLNESLDTDNPTDDHQDQLKDVEGKLSAAEERMRDLGCGSALRGDEPPSKEELELMEPKLAEALVRGYWECGGRAG